MYSNSTAIWYQKLRNEQVIHVTGCTYWQYGGDSYVYM